jgi:hypothetical protein
LLNANNYILDIDKEKAMDRHDPIDYDAYRRRASSLRNAAIAEFIDSIVQAVCAGAAQLREFARPAFTPPKRPARRADRTGLVA